MRLMAESGILCPCVPALPLGHILGAQPAAFHLVAVCGLRIREFLCLSGLVGVVN